jgi:hypothetical protein
MKRRRANFSAKSAKSAKFALDLLSLLLVIRDSVTAACDKL